MTVPQSIAASLLEADGDLPWNPELEPSYPPKPSDWIPPVKPSSDPDDVDPTTYLNAMLAEDRKIAITYSECWWPEGQEDYEEEHGWVDEEGESMNLDEWDREEGLTNVTKAVWWLKDKGVEDNGNNDWYTGPSEENFRNGHTRQLSYHLKGYTPHELEQIHDALFPPRARRVAEATDPDDISPDNYLKKINGSVLPPSETKWMPLSRPSFLASARLWNNTGHKLKIRPAELREIFMERWFTSMDEKDFCRYMLDGHLVYIDGEVIPANDLKQREHHVSESSDPDDVNPRAYIQKLPRNTGRFLPNPWMLRSQAHRAHVLQVAKCWNNIGHQLRVPPTELADAYTKSPYVVGIDAKTMCALLQSGDLVYKDGKIVEPTELNQ